MTRKEHEARKVSDPAYAKAMEEISKFCEDAIEPFELTKHLENR